VDPYAKPNERKTGPNRPKVSHVPPQLDRRSRGERRAEKRAVIDERRAIKKAARQDLKRELRKEISGD
jgi:hypothetical protein